MIEFPDRVWVSNGDLWVSRPATEVDRVRRRDVIDNWPPKIETDDDMKRYLLAYMTGHQVDKR